MKKKLTGLFLIIVMVFSMAGNVFANGYGKEVDVNIMSYNIHHGVGLDGVLDLERIAKVITDAGA